MPGATHRVNENAPTPPNPEPTTDEDIDAIQEDRRKSFRLRRTAKNKKQRQKSSKTSEKQTPKIKEKLKHEPKLPTPPQKPEKPILSEKPKKQRSPKSTESEKLSEKQNSPKNPEIEKLSEKQSSPRNAEKIPHVDVPKKQEMPKLKLEIPVNAPKLEIPNKSETPEKSEIPISPDIVIIGNIEELKAVQYPKIVDNIVHEPSALHEGFNTPPITSSTELVSPERLRKISYKAQQKALPEKPTIKKDEKDEQNELPDKPPDNPPDEKNRVNDEKSVFDTKQLLYDKTTPLTFSDIVITDFGDKSDGEKSDNEASSVTTDCSSEISIKPLEVEIVEEPAPVPKREPPAVPPNKPHIRSVSNCSVSSVASITSTGDWSRNTSRSELPYGTTSNIADIIYNLFL